MKAGVRGTKKQITVRVDKKLLQAAIQSAENKGLKLAQAVEEGLALYLRERPSAETLEGRRLYNRLSLRVQRLTEALWSYLSCPSHRSLEDRHMQQMIKGFLEEYCETPKFAEEAAQLRRRLGLGDR